MSADPSVPAPRSTAPRAARTASTSSNSAPSTSRSSSATTPPPGCARSSRIHSTALGPGLGGTRFYPYATHRRDAIRDVLDLSRGMTYKNALAGPRPRRRQGRHHRRPGEGRSPRRCCGPTAGSCSRWAVATSPPATSGTYSEDMDHVARECDFVTGRTVANGGAGDSSVLTAYGVFQGMRAARRGRLGRARRWPGAPSASPASARSAGTSSGTWSTDGASVVVTDVNERGRRPGARGVRRVPRWPRRRRAGAGRDRRVRARAPWATRSPTRWSTA